MKFDLFSRSLAAHTRLKDNNIVNVTVQHYYVCENVGRRESRTKLMLSFCLRLEDLSLVLARWLLVDVATTRGKKDHRYAQEEISCALPRVKSVYTVRLG